MCVCARWQRRACAGALLVLLALATAARAERSERDKRAESELLSPMPFLMATRYGRSSPPRHLAPRNDRFFMSTRYGKRSDVTLTGGAGGAEVRAVSGVEEGDARALLCEYTGVFPLYRCRHKPAQYDKRSAEQAVEREDE